MALPTRERVPAHTAKETKEQKLTYGEGQREQYGEGTSYRPEEKTGAADEFTEHGFAGGARKKKAIPDTRKPDGDCT